MRVTYGRQLSVKAHLDSDKIDNYLPMREEWVLDENGHPQYRVVPAVSNLIFIHSSQHDITQLKMFRSEYTPLRYITNRFSHDFGDRLLTVPDRQMENFIHVASANNEKVKYLEYNPDFFAKPGRRVRITQGPFKGAEGTVRRIKKQQCIVVEIKGFVAVAITFVPSAWLEPIAE